MPAYLPKNSTKWIIKFQINKKIYKRTIPEATCKEEAETAERDWRNGLALHTRWETTGTIRTNRGAVGGVAELLVCADLLRRGYDVFRSVSSTSSCDVVIIKDGITCRVEVKAGRTLKNGGGAFVVRPNQIGLHDVVAAALLDTSHIDYRPPVDLWFEKKKSALAA